MPINISDNEYKKLADRKNPSSKVFSNCVRAFLYGGLICTVGQLFLSFYESLTAKETASTLTSITMIFIGVLLTGLGIYPKIAKQAGAGSLVPITGFANAVSSPAIEAKTEGYVLGVGTKIFTIAGPVILFGSLASFFAGLYYFFISI